MKKQFIFNAVLLAISALIYAVNYFVKRGPLGISIPFIRNHLNDLIAPIVVLSYSSILLNLKKRCSIVSPFMVFGICTFCAIVWEWMAPQLISRSVGDYIDVLCYYTGGFMYCSIMNYVFTRKGEV